MHVSDPTPQQETVAAWCAERAARQHIAAGDETPDPVIAILGTARPRRCTRHHLGRDVQEVRHARPSGAPVHLGRTEREADHRRRPDRRDPPPHPRLDLPRLRPARRRPGRVLRRRGPQPRRLTVGVLDLTDLLVERGIARSEIGWVHDITDPNRRQPLWDQVRSGHTRILIGSTMQMGVGVNIQTRLYAAHELTAPYRPDWLEQAEGRLIRQGNHNDRAEVHRYVTERTADANSWQILQRKAHFIAQAMSDPEQMTRDLRDESVATVAEEFATIAAIATGDHRHIDSPRSPPPPPDSNEPNAPITPHATHSAATSATPNASSAGSPTRSPPSTGCAHTTPTRSTSDSN